MRLSAPRLAGSSRMLNAIVLALVGATVVLAATSIVASRALGTPLLFAAKRLWLPLGIVVVSALYALIMAREHRRPMNWRIHFAILPVVAACVYFGFRAARLDSPTLAHPHWPVAAGLVALVAHAIAWILAMVGSALDAKRIGRKAGAVRAQENEDKAAPGDGAASDEDFSGELADSEDMASRDDASLASPSRPSSQRIAVATTVIAVIGLCAGAVPGAARLTAPVTSTTVSSQPGAGTAPTMIKGEAVWTRSLGAARERGRLFVGARAPLLVQSRTVGALSPEDGSDLWVWRANTGRVRIDDDWIAVSPDGTRIAFVATAFDPDDSDVIDSFDHLIVLDALTGEEVWTRPLDDRLNETSDRNLPPIIATNRALAFGPHVLDISTGAELWTVDSEKSIIAHVGAENTFLVYTRQPGTWKPENALPVGCERCEWNAYETVDDVSGSVTRSDIGVVVPILKASDHPPMRGWILIHEAAEQKNYFLNIDSQNKVDLPDQGISIDRFSSDLEALSTTISGKTGEHSYVDDVFPSDPFTFDPATGALVGDSAADHPGIRVSFNENRPVPTLVVQNVIGGTIGEFAFVGRNWPLGGGPSINEAVHNGDGLALTVTRWDDEYRWQEIVFIR